MLDNERWRAADIPRDFQSLVTHCELCEQLTTVIDESSSDRDHAGSVSTATSASSTSVSLNNSHYTTVG